MRTKTRQARLKGARSKLLREIRALRRNGQALSARIISLKRPGMNSRARLLFGGWAEAVVAAGLDYEDIRLIRRWTKASIIATLRDEWRKGRDVRVGGIERRLGGLAKASKRLIGPWRETLEAAGIEPAGLVRRSWRKRKDVLHELRRLCATVVQPWEVRGERRDLVSEAEHHFGSFTKAVHAAGISYGRRPRVPKWPRERILQEIRNVARRGTPLRYTEFERRGAQWLTTALRTFGSWRATVEAAGCTYPGRSWKWPSDQIIGKLREISDSGVHLRGRGASFFKHSHRGLVVAAKRRFGSWAAALDAAGLGGSHPWPLKQWSPRELLAILTDIWRQEGRPRKRHLSAIQKPGYAQPNYSIRRHFGSWRRAIGILGFAGAPRRRPAVAPRTPRRVSGSRVRRN